MELIDQSNSSNDLFILVLKNKCFTNSFHIVVAYKCILEILWPNSEVTEHVLISMINFQMIFIAHPWYPKTGKSRRDVLESSVVLRFWGAEDKRNQYSTRQWGCNTNTSTKGHLCDPDMAIFWYCLLISVERMRPRQLIVSPQTGDSNWFSSVVRKKEEKNWVLL